MLNILSFSGSVDPEAVMLLTNAVHFKEAWTVAFTEIVSFIKLLHQH
jgi:NADH:ubiquinone oxidoreductase subunit 3 (subunit A)